MNKEKVGEILLSARSVNVAVVGDMMLDVYIWGRTSRISQEAPVPVVQVDRRSESPGGASNVMRNITTLGGGAKAFGILGGDSNGGLLRSRLDDYGVDTVSLRTCADRTTTEKQRIISGGQQLLRVDYDVLDAVSADLRSQVADDISKALRSGAVQAVVMEDYAKGFFDECMIRKIAVSARDAGAVAALDPHPSRPVELDGLTLATPNLSEAFSLAGLYPPAESRGEKFEKALNEVAAKLFSMWKVEILLITLGAQGMALFENGKRSAVIPTRAIEVFDVSGAGDTVIAAFTLALAAGAGARDAAEIANHAAGIVVGKVGTVSVSAGELLESFDRQAL